MITRPDQYKHQNDAYAIVDNADVRGGIFDVEDLTTGYLNAIPSDKRKLRTAVTNGADSKIYIYSGTDVLDANWGNTSNWVLASGGSVSAGKGTILNAGAIDVGTEDGTYETSGWTWRVGEGSYDRSTISLDQNTLLNNTSATILSDETRFLASGFGTLGEGGYLVSYILTKASPNDGTGVRSQIWARSQDVTDRVLDISMMVETDITASTSTNTELKLSANGVTGVHTVTLSSEKAGFAGLQYGADYSASYTDRSLVDKAWVVANGGSGYTHPTGFTDQPASALTGASVISQIDVTAEGHVNGVVTRNISGLVPTGGTTGQVLKKVSNANYDYSWQSEATYGETSANFNPTTVTILTTDGLSGFNTKIGALSDNLKGGVLVILFENGIHTFTGALDLSGFYNGKIIAQSQSASSATVNITTADNYGILIPGNNIEFVLTSMTVNYTNTGGNDIDRFIGFSDSSGVGISSSFTVKHLTLGITSNSISNTYLLTVAGATEHVILQSIILTLSISGSFRVLYQAPVVSTYAKVIGKPLMLYINYNTSNVLATSLFTSAALSPTIIFYRESTTFVTAPASSYNTIVYSV